MRETELADFFRLLSHPDRIRVIQELSPGDMAVEEIARALSLSHSRVSQHLGLMRACRIVERRSVGRRRIYNLAQPDLDGWLSRVSRYAADRGVPATANQQE